MFKTFTPDELLAQWRLARHLEPLRADVAVTFDGARTDPIDRMELEQWWLETLDTAPDSWLQWTDFTGDATVKLAPDGQSVLLTTPRQKPLLRPRALRMEGWEADALIVPPGHPLHQLQMHPLTAASPSQPVAVAIDPNTLQIYPPSSLKLTSLQAVDENNYTFDVRCLKTMNHDCI